MRSFFSRTTHRVVVPNQDSVSVRSQLGTASPALVVVVSQTDGKSIQTVVSQASSKGSLQSSVPEDSDCGSRAAPALENRDRISRALPSLDSPELSRMAERELHVIQ